MLVCFVHSQILEYEEFKNASDSHEQEYEEYEIYEDRFDHAERERPDTWGGEVLFCNSIINDLKTQIHSLFI